MLTFRRRPSPSRVRRRAALRLDTFEERTLPAVAVGVNVNSTQSDLFPPLGNSGAVSPNNYVQFATGQFTVFDKNGAVVNQVSENAFWLNAGITQAVVDQLVSQPRVVYDPISDRWFAVEITLTNTNNLVLIARSNTNDPAATAGNWTALSYTAVAGQFGNFPMLAVDKNAVYVGTGNFTTSASGGQPSGSTMTSIPKIVGASLQTMLDNKTQVTQTADIFGNGVTMGWSPQAVTNFDPTDTTASVVATHYVTFDLISYWEITGSGGAGATFGSTSNLAIPHNALPGLVRQPDGTRNISGGNDDRYTGAAFQVGDLIYAVHPISVNSSGVGTTAGANTTDGIQLIVMRDSTNTVVTTKNFFNTSYDYTYPSVSANAFGDIVIGFNRSGGTGSASGNLGAYAIYARINPANPGAGVTELATVELQAGLYNGYLLTGVPTPAGEPWGPYTSTSVDPSDPFSFWTTAQYAKTNTGGESMWGTKVSQVLVSPRALTVSSPTADGTYSNGNTIDITVAFNGPVTVTGTPQLALNSGGTANYFSGSGTSTLTFRYIVGASDSAADLDYTAAGINLNGGTINHVASGFGVPAELTLPAPGTTGSLGANKNLVVQAQQATAAVTGVSSTAANGAYAAGASIPITITFDRAVTVSGSPRLALNTGANATYTSGSGSTTLVFTYTVAAGQNTADLDYTSTSALTLNGGTINDQVNGTAATLTLPAPGAAGSLGANKDIVIDTQPPVVTGVSSTTANGAYAAGASMPITVTFSEAVAVNTAGGTPRIALNSGGTALYTGGTGTTILTFTYTVAAGQNAADL
ncbi:MAG TPA: hypothetical protein VKD90_29045, partial [Gemmataceae bacterium]|nr:hypothetical protein [Gemmataceae bacterium]